MDQEVKNQVEEENLENTDQEDLNNKEIPHEEALEKEADEEKEVEEKSGEEATLEEQLAEQKDKYLRMYSEFENYRRRTAKEKLEIISTASKEVVIDMLPILDDIARALNSIGDEKGPGVEGLEIISHKFQKTLENRGVKKMEIKAGDEFDAEVHEAVTQIPAPSPELAGKIVDVIEPGYFLNDKVIRFAKVVTGAQS